jgi:acyl-CoA thioester hydrolase
MSALAPSSGVIRGDVHVYALRVFYEDTDAAGIVYYANYLRYVERARTELLRLLGLEHGALLESHGIFFAVRRCLVDYLRPARLDDALEVHSRLIEVRRASLEAEQIVKRRGAELVRIELLLACIDRAGKPARLPAAIRDPLVILSQSEGRS